jgi:hypothetical protein
MVTPNASLSVIPTPIPPRKPPLSLVSVSMSPMMGAPSWVCPTTTFSTELKLACRKLILIPMSIVLI